MDDKPINTPFADLPDLVKSRKINLKVPEAPQHPSSVEGKENPDLFVAAMEGVKAMDRKKNRIVGHPPAEHLPIRHEPDSRKLLEDAVREKRNFNVTNMPEYMEGYVEGINPITMEKLRAGDFAVQKILDLHGYSVDDAGEAFRSFIYDAVREGLNCVKVIHGRGLKSKGVPVLKEGLKSWIIRAMHRKWVLAFCNAVMRNGGPGATYILLKKQPLKKRIQIIG